MALDRLSNFDQKWQSKKNKGFLSANNQRVELLNMFKIFKRFRNQPSGLRQPLYLAKTALPSSKAGDFLANLDNFCGKNDPKFN